VVSIEVDQQTKVVTVAIKNVVLSVCGIQVAIGWVGFAYDPKTASVTFSGDAKC
jgi:hypothetical protein